MVENFKALYVLWATLSVSVAFSLFLVPDGWSDRVLKVLAAVQVVACIAANWAYFHG